MKYTKAPRQKKPTTKAPRQKNPYGRTAVRPDKPDIPRQTLNPRLDIVFKLLFSRYPRCLIHLLSAVLRRPVSDVEILNPQIQPETPGDKAPILDLRVRLGDGTHVHVEMQLCSHAGLRKRELYYWARAYSAQLGSGQEYTVLQPTFGIFFLDFNDLDEERFHSIFRLLEIHSHRPLTDALELHVLELPKLPQATPDAAADPVLHWCKFLASNTDEEREHLAMNDPQIQEALKHLSQDRWVQELAFERELELNSIRKTMELEVEKAVAQAVEQTKELARKEGEARGRAEAARQLLQKLLRLKFPDASESALSPLANATEQQLDTWAERVLTAGTIDEVFS